jgi:hypothetical protein
VFNEIVTADAMSRSMKQASIAIGKLNIGRSLHIVALSDHKFTLPKRLQAGFGVGKLCGHGPFQWE